MDYAVIYSVLFPALSTSLPVRDRARSVIYHRGQCVLMVADHISPQPCYIISETIHLVVIDHANRLHKSITNS